MTSEIEILESVLSLLEKVNGSLLILCAIGGGILVSLMFQRR